MLSRDDLFPDVFFRFMALDFDVAVAPTLGNFDNFWLSSRFGDVEDCG